ncbi:YybH family protein [Tumebacillus lipolyticus]|uniref:YybH family protein n=1 Tax=Tumebacillus lipolyticus TaxID=1280370 RepID=A0ABW4ZUX9_9BACL
MTFHEALQTHLKALTEKDLTNFLPTVHEENLSLILPTGSYLNNRQEFESFHQGWFSDPDWSMHYEVVKTVVTAEMGLALLNVLYNDLDPQGQPYEKRYYLTLVFQKQGEDWLLVHDQNTFQN